MSPEAACSSWDCEEGKFQKAQLGPWQHRLVRDKCMTPTCQLVSPPLPEHQLYSRLTRKLGAQSVCVEACVQQQHINDSAERVTEFTTGIGQVMVSRTAHEPQVEGREVIKGLPEPFLGKGVPIPLITVEKKRKQHVGAPQE